MAVVTKFVVVREGVEKMTFTSKKEADAYDKMLDVADNLIPFLQKSELEIDDGLCEKLCFYLAQHKDTLQGLLKGSAKVEATTKKSKSKKVDDKKEELID